MVLARANAIMNQVFVVSVNAAGPVGTGQSVIVDPEGLVRVHSATEATVLTDVLDLEHVSRVRQYGTVGLTRPWALLGLLAAPLALPPVRTVLSGGVGRDLIGALQGTGRLTLVTGVLLAVGLALS